MLLRRMGLAFAAAGCLCLSTVASATDQEKEKGAEKDKTWAPAVKPKDLTAVVKKGLSWLAEHQLPNGAWGQGEESANMGGSMDGYKDKGNVADSCMATLALIRAGSTPSSGPHATQVKKGVEFVLSEIEASDKDSLFVTNVRGTRVQGKIGAYVDTFMSSMLLSEVKGKSGDEKLDRRVTVALNKVLAKIEKNQRANGTWDGSGWAPVLSQAMAAKGMNRAAQAGVAVDRQVLAKTEEYAQGQYDSKSGSFGGEGSAGVNLYSAAANAGTMRDARNTKESEIEADRATAKNGKDQATRDAAQKRVKAYDTTIAQQSAMENGLVARLDDAGFVSGFGSNGGEEFLSYMLVSESLVVKGGSEWKKWDDSMAQNLNRVQNGDGSWSGHHCITGRTFVTSAALLVLTADRAPVPVAAMLKRG